VLECSLPSGGRAILTAEYDWSLLAEVIPADLSKRLNQEPWQIVFDTKESRGAQRPPQSVSHVHGSKACHRIGVIDGIPVINMSYLEPDGKWFRPPPMPKALLLEPGVRSQPPAIRAKLEAMGATPVLDYALILPRNGRLVYELALISIKHGEKGGVVAVFQSTSTDGGASWSEPQITGQAEIYVLNVPPFAQPFQGRAIKLNGKEIRSE
jgi:hypothetical protein